ncbi:MAG: hypothetical protein EOO46_06750 [Flavobacterium sp.]|nr:MAG: hypothetical protein EOO46_06750 [Flavobacterium sp.]
MKNTILLSVLFTLFFYAIGTAQSENKQLILGCWEIRQVIFTKEVEGSDDISMEALGTIICFEKDGTFTNKRGETIAKGTYKLSENGRTIHQNSVSEIPAPNNHIQEDVPGQIMMLSATELQIQAEEMILYFRRGE